MRLLLSVMLSALLSFNAFAEDEEGTGAAYVGYIELKPFVTNFDGGDELRFLKCEVTIQVDEEEAHHYINSNLAQIRNDLIFLFAEQTEEQVRGVVAQQDLAARALQIVRTGMIEETGSPQASDLFFTSFVIQ